MSNRKFSENTIGSPLLWGGHEGTTKCEAVERFSELEIHLPKQAFHIDRGQKRA